MVSLPREISPGTGARRSLLADLIAALAIALLALQLAAGIGVIGFLATLVILVLVSWIAVEAAIHKLVRRRKVHRPMAARSRSLN